MILNVKNYIYKLFISNHLKVNILFIYYIIDGFNFSQSLPKLKKDFDRGQYIVRYGGYNMI